MTSEIIIKAFKPSFFAKHKLFEFWLCRQRIHYGYFVVEKQISDVQIYIKAQDRLLAKKCFLYSNGIMDHLCPKQVTFKYLYFHIHIKLLYIHRPPVTSTLDQFV